MKYPYTTLLELFAFLLIIFIGIVIFYLLVKRWQKTKFITVLKAFVLYEFGSILIFLIFPYPLFARILKFNYLKIIDLIIFGAVLFFVFYFISKKFLSINWKKSLIAFLLIIILIFPILEFIKIKFEYKIVNYSVFAEESKKYNEAFKLRIFSLVVPTEFKILTFIESATLSWPSVRLSELLIEMQ